MIQYSVVIPTNRTDQTIGPLLISLTNQTIAPHEIVIVADIDFVDEEEKSSYVSYIETLLCGHRHTIITHRSHPDFIPGQGASYVRNYGFRMASSDYILAIDDDNILDATMMDQLRKEYTAIDLPAKQGVVIPSEKYRNTDTIRSQGYSHFRYRLGRVRPEHVVTDVVYKKILFSSSNCIFGPRQLFVDCPLDERIPFVYEDFEWTSRLSKSVSLYALTHVYIHHMMRSKTLLEDSYLATPCSAYYKAKHRIIRVRSTATTRQQIQYFTLGLHLHTASLVYKIIRYASLRQRLGLLWAVVRGTCSGICAKRKGAPYT